MQVLEEGLWRVARALEHVRPCPSSSAMVIAPGGPADGQEGSCSDAVAAATVSHAMLRRRLEVLRWALAPAKTRPPGAAQSASRGGFGVLVVQAPKTPPGLLGADGIVALGWWHYGRTLTLSSDPRTISSRAGSPEGRPDGSRRQAAAYRGEARWPRTAVQSVTAGGMGCGAAGDHGVRSSADHGAASVGDVETRADNQWRPLWLLCSQPNGPRHGEHMTSAYGCAIARRSRIGDG